MKKLAAKTVKANSNWRFAKEVGTHSERLRSWEKRETAIRKFWKEAGKAYPDTKVEAYRAELLTGELRELPVCPEPPPPPPPPGPPGREYRSQLFGGMVETEASKLACLDYEAFMRGYKFALSTPPGDE